MFTDSVHLKYDLFAVDGDVTTCFHNSFTFLIEGVEVLGVFGESVFDG